jgi:predicted ArsR family transcriptional regulator
MAAAGFEPRFRRMSGSVVDVTLRDCPFRDLTDDHRELACTLHLGLVEGMSAGLKPPMGVREFTPLIERGICKVRLA